MRESNICEPPRQSLFRGQPAPVDSESVTVQRHGGDKGAGVLFGVSLIARGEALGHDQWIDHETLAQVVELTNRGNHGLKSRFTHPGMSSDGLGRHLGRVKNARIEGDRALGDLHFAKSAHETPDGNLAEYVMSLAEEDPEAAGLSIVFEHDEEAEQAFLKSNEASPDELNEKNLPHVRVGDLRAADVVDEPAANPDGLFDRLSEARDYTSLLDYAAGLTDTCSFDGVAPERARQFFTRWLSSHELTLTPTAEETPMAEQTTTVADVAPEPTREDFTAQLDKFVESFGAENGTAWFRESLSYEDALSKHCEALQADNERLQAERDEALQKLTDVNIGEDEPIDTGATDEPTAKKSFADATRRPSRN